MRIGMNERNFVLFFCSFVACLMQALHIATPVMLFFTAMFLIYTLVIVNKKEPFLHMDKIGICWSIISSIMILLNNELAIAFFVPTLIVLFAVYLLSCQFACSTEKLRFKRKKRNVLIVLPFAYVLFMSMYARTSESAEPVTYFIILSIGIIFLIAGYVYNDMDKEEERKWKDAWADDYAVSLQEYYGTKKDPQ